MQILLTGGSGAVGKSVVDRLVRSGFAVRVIGRRSDMVFEGAEYLSCDINNYAHLREVIRGCRAVVHLAALPNPAAGTPEEVFRVNAQGTFNVFQAAAEEGIRRVVQASSINATGQFYGVKPAPLLYLPMDEEHPCLFNRCLFLLQACHRGYWRLLLAARGHLQRGLPAALCRPGQRSRRDLTRTATRIQTLVEDLLHPHAGRTAGLV